MNAMMTMREGFRTRFGVDIIDISVDRMTIIFMIFSVSCNILGGYPESINPGNERFRNRASLPQNLNSQLRKPKKLQHFEIGLVHGRSRNRSETIKKIVAM